MILAGIILVLALAALIRFSDVFVDAVVSIAERYKMPKMVISLTLAAFCTCAPELAISFNSIMSGNVELTLANVIGSLVVNILLIVGIAAIVKPIKVREKTIKKELPLLLIITLAFVFLICDTIFVKDASNILNRADGIMLIIWFIAFMFYVVNLARKNIDLTINKPKYSKKEAIISTIVCIIGIIISSDLVVESAVLIANYLEISQKIIAMTIIVIGTSLPELTITTISAKKGEFDMAIGNIIGTNIFNICIVLGLPVAIFGSITSIQFNYIDFLVVLLAATMFAIFGRSNKELSRREGILMVMTFVVYYIYIFLQ